jgi:hypothetical protein
MQNAVFCWRAIFGGVRTYHKSDIEGRKPDSKIAWSLDPYRFPYQANLQLEIEDRFFGHNKQKQ